RIEAHICISFVSYLMYKELERVLSESDSGISIKKAINSINKMYEIVLEDKNGNKKSILLKKKRGSTGNYRNSLPFLLKWVSNPQNRKNPSVSKMKLAEMSRTLDSYLNVDDNTFEI